MPIRLGTSWMSPRNTSLAVRRAGICNVRPVWNRVGCPERRPEIHKERPLSFDLYLDLPKWRRFVIPSNGRRCLLHGGCLIFAAAIRLCPPNFALSSSPSAPPGSWVSTAERSPSVPPGDCHDLRHHNPRIYDVNQSHSKSKMATIVNGKIVSQRGGE